MFIWKQSLVILKSKYFVNTYFDKTNCQLILKEMLVSCKPGGGTSTASQDCRLFKFKYFNKKVDMKKTPLTSKT